MPKPRAIKAAAVYCRISIDRAGESLGVERQEKLCRKLAADRGWPVAEVYVDNDISAYSGKVRPGYSKLVDDLKNGVRDAVLAVDQDRLNRRLGELNDFIELCAENRIPIVLSSGELDTTTADGVLRAQILGAVAQNESAKKSERIKRQKDQSAIAGTFKGGKRPFGYEPDGMTLRKSEAKLIKEAARRVLAGESVRKIAIDWNARNIPAASGGAWSTPSLKGVLCSPRIAGLRVHHGDVVGEAKWPQIIDRATHEQLRALVIDSQYVKRGRPAVHLLSGVLRCKRCGGKMYFSPLANGGRYVCDSRPHGCGVTGIKAELLEDFITQAVLYRLDSPTVHKAAKKPRKGNAHVTFPDLDLGAIERELEEVAGDYGEGRISRREWLAIRTPLERRRDDARRQIRNETTDPALNDFRTGDVGNLWKNTDMEKRRAVLNALLVKIEVGPGTAGRRGLDEGRLDVEWRI
jgi:site-specific DNA recombinase